jgi:hypothetical protein
MVNVRQFITNDHPCVYTCIRGKGLSRFFMMKFHMERLASSLDIVYPRHECDCISRDTTALVAKVTSILKLLESVHLRGRMRDEDTFLTLTCKRGLGAGDGGHDGEDDLKVNALLLFITSPPVLTPGMVKSVGASVVATKILLCKGERRNPLAKSSSWLLERQQYDKARDAAKVQEVVLHQDNVLLEGLTSNIFLVSKMPLVVAKTLFVRFNILCFCVMVRLIPRVESTPQREVNEFL